MSEIWLRLLIVSGALLVSLVVVIAIRRRSTKPATLSGGSLGPGVYLFTSSSCADCIGARARMEEVLGASGFIEIAWDDEPTLFTALGIDLVPCTLVVGDDGSASRYPGMPEQALRSLGP